MNQTDKCLQEFWRRITPWRSSICLSTPELISLSLSLSLAWRWSKDQISITLSLSLSKYLDLIFFFALPRFACAIVTFVAPRQACLLFSLAQPRDACLLFSFSQPRYACVGLLWFLLTISSSFIAFHDFQKAAKSLQNWPKAAFLEKRACAFPHLLACAFDSKSVRNLDVSFFFF